MRRFLAFMMVLSIVILSTAVVVAQDGDAEATPEATEALEPWVCPPGFEGQHLSIYNWSTYIADNTVPDFEAACGVTVSYDIYDSNEAMLARIRQGNPGYDIVVPSDYTISQMAREGLLEPLDLSKIPNFKNVDPELQNPPYDPGNQYSVPYQWGTVGIGYNTQTVTEPITSWQQMFDFQGRVAWLDDNRAMFGIALTMLGYDPNTTDQSQIDEAKQYLIDHGSNVVTIAQDDGQAWLQRGDVDMTVEYSGDIFALADDCGCDTYAYAIPEEGSNIWIDNLAIPKDAPNPDLAMAFIDYVLDPQVGADISNYTAYASPNKASIDLGLIDQDLLDNPAIYPSEELMQKLFFIKDSPPDVETAYNNAWDEVIIYVGQ